MANTYKNINGKTSGTAPKKRRRKKKSNNYLYIGIALSFAAVMLLSIIIFLISCSDSNVSESSFEESVVSQPINAESSQAGDESESESGEESSEDENSQEVSQEESSEIPIVTGWIEENGSRFYYGENGEMTVGKAEIDGKIYIFNEDGKMLSSGWNDFENEHYYLNEDGSAFIGWLEEGGHKFYLQADGTAAQGEKEIDGKKYFFTEAGRNFIMVNPWNYVPEDYDPELVQVSSSYAGNEKIEKECYEALKKMMNACWDAGYSVYVVDGYRTNDDQAWLFNRKVNSYINQGYSQDEAYNLAKEWSAVPGTSEHELGLALDIIDTEIWDLCEEQEDLAGQKWLMENCYKYGFILRYPKDKKDETGINYEPWHYRYLGVDIATEIHQSGLTVEAYLKSISE